MQNKKFSVNFDTFKTLLYMFIDATIILITYLLGFLADNQAITNNMLLFSVIAVIFKIIIYSVFGIYKTIHDHISIVDEIKFAILVGLTNAFLLIVTLIPQVKEVVYMGIVPTLLITLSEAILVIGVRLVKRIIRFYYGSLNLDGPRTMIVGAGSAAKIIYNEIHTNKIINNKIVCFIDDDIEKIGKTYLSSPVVGPIKNASKYIAKYKVSEVIIAIAGLSKKDLKEIIGVFSKENVKLKRLPILTEMDLDSNKVTIQDVSLAELLGRDEISFDDKQIREFITNKRVLVTGGGGSIGSELCRQIFSYKPSELTIFDIYENNAYDIQQELVRKMKKENIDIKLNVIIGSTYNETRVEEIFDKYRPEIVFHAAAYKHVPLMEDSPVEAIRTNCLGTYNVAKMADRYKTHKMVLVSTDKAVRPTNTMGASKRFAEMIIQYFASISKHTYYSAVRFGNVLGSNGSVIPLFKKQIEEGGPVTVTHKDIVRYFMTIPEAVSLILQSGAFATGGEIFILDMGKPVRIVTLAENLIRQSGLVPYEDIEIIYTGLRPGEKLFEELLIDTSTCLKTANEKIFVEKIKNVYPMDENIIYISRVFNMTNNEEIKNCLKKVVTNYANYEEFNLNAIRERELVK